MTPSVSPKWDQNRSAPHASPPARCSAIAARGHVVPSSIATASGGPTTASTCRSDRVRLPGRGHRDVRVRRRTGHALRDRLKRRPQPDGRVHAGQCPLNGAERRARNAHLGIRVRHLTHDAALPSPAPHPDEPLPGASRSHPRRGRAVRYCTYLRGDNSTPFDRPLSVTKSLGMTTGHRLSCFSHPSRPQWRQMTSSCPTLSANLGTVSPYARQRGCRIHRGRLVRRRAH